MARRRKSLVRTIYKVMALQFVLFFVVVIVIEVVVIGVIKFRNRIRPDTVLVVDVRGSVAEEAPRGFWEEATRGRVKVMSDFLEAIDRAARDSRINGLVVRVGGGGMNMAKLQELRAKIREFNRGGNSAPPSLSPPRTAATTWPAPASRLPSFPNRFSTFAA